MCSFSVSTSERVNVILFQGRLGYCLIQGRARGDSPGQVSTSATATTRTITATALLCDSNFVLSLPPIPIISLFFSEIIKRKSEQDFSARIACTSSRTERQGHYGLSAEQYTISYTLKIALASASGSTRSFLWDRRCNYIIPQLKWQDISRPCG